MWGNLSPYISNSHCCVFFFSRKIYRSLFVASRPANSWYSRPIVYIDLIPCFFMLHFPWPVTGTTRSPLPPRGVPQRTKRTGDRNMRKNRYGFHGGFPARKMGASPKTLDDLQRKILIWMIWIWMIWRYPDFLGTPAQMYMNIEMHILMEKNMEVLTSRRLVIACFSRAQIRSSQPLPLNSGAL